jgi:glutathione S-transferase
MLTAESLKLLIALHEKGLSPGSLDQAMTDSQFALEYLAEAYEPRLAPTDPAGWYDIQAWTAQLDQGLSANVRLLGQPGTKAQAMAGWDQVTSDAEATEDQLANARERIGTMVDKLEAALATSDWLVGGAYSVADINAFALTHTLPQLTPELVNGERTPKLTAYLARIAERPAVRAALS